MSKAIDKAAGAEREVVGIDAAKAERFRSALAGQNGGWDRPWMHEPDADVRKAGITAPATPEAAAWSGWGTALKPSFEPIILARKPLQGTVAANVLAHGTGALNVDACRVRTADALGGGMVSMGRPKVSEGWDRPWMHDSEVTERKKGEAADKVAHAESLGRWPANVLHDGSDEVEAAFAAFGDAPGSNATQGQSSSVMRLSTARLPVYPHTSLWYTGTAARFFKACEYTDNELLLCRAKAILAAWIPTLRALWTIIPPCQAKPSLLL